MRPDAGSGIGAMESLAESPPSCAPDDEAAGAAIYNGARI